MYKGNYSHAQATLAGQLFFRQYKQSKQVVAVKDAGPSVHVGNGRYWQDVVVTHDSSDQTLVNQ
jgi:uncharacterized protein with von Willebrand factor type A (vWA) domain